MNNLEEKIYVLISCSNHRDIQGVEKKMPQVWKRADHTGKRKEKEREM
jgi:hypothetical protein